ncbi:MAG: hypothetical protein R3E77_10680 [Steroidobacteraceae bacterium]
MQLPAGAALPLPTVVAASLETFRNRSRIDPNHDTIEVIWYLTKFPQPAALARLKELSRSRNYLVSYNAKRACAIFDKTPN